MDTYCKIKGTDVVCVTYKHGHTYCKIKGTDEVCVTYKHGHTCCKIKGLKNNLDFCLTALDKGILSDQR
jgi:hypothetical protein